MSKKTDEYALPGGLTAAPTDHSIAVNHFLSLASAALADQAALAAYRPSMAHQPFVLCMLMLDSARMATHPERSETAAPSEHGLLTAQR
jgi:hypothetical protein